MNYSEKFKDPRWQKKRLEIFERDDWTCQMCYDTDTTLAVHHRRYLPNKDPWDYPNHLLITLCESCHEAEREQWVEYEGVLIEQLKEKFFADDLRELAYGINRLEISNYDSHVIASVYGYAFGDKDIQRELIERFWENLRGKSTTE